MWVLEHVVYASVRSKREQRALEPNAFEWDQIYSRSYSELDKCVCIYVLSCFVDVKVKGIRM